MTTRDALHLLRAYAMVFIAVMLIALAVLIITQGVALFSDAHPHHSELQRARDGCRPGQLTQFHASGRGDDDGLRFSCAPRGAR